MSAQPVVVGAVLDRAYAALHAAATDEAGLTLAEGVLQAINAIAALVVEADIIADALTQDGRTPAGMTKETAAKRLRAALAPFGGEP